MAQTNIPPSATRLTPLQLNSYKLDVQHTILTPDYLDKLASEESAGAEVQNQPSA